MLIKEKKTKLKKMKINQEETKDYVSIDFMHLFCKLLHIMCTATVASRVRRKRESKKCIPAFTCYFSFDLNKEDDMPGPSGSSHKDKATDMGLGII